MIRTIKRLDRIIRKYYSSWYKTRFHLKEKNFSEVNFLSKQQKNDIINFWKAYPCHYKIQFLQYYCHFAGTSSFYIPDDIWYNIILPYYNNKTLAQQIDDKCLYDIFLKNCLMPKSVLRIIDGRLYDSDYNIVPSEHANQILLKLKDNLIIKPSISTCGGWGVRRISDWENVDILNIRKEYPNAIIQQIVKQSACLNKLNSSSLNTIRISSLILNDGTLMIPAATMRMGMNGSFVDNVCSGGVFVGIDIDSGTLKEFGYSRSSGRYKKFIAHPNSGVIFKGYKICGFEKVIEIIKSNAKYLPKTRLLGWDFTLDIENKPVMIEVNIEDHEIEMMQLANGPYFGTLELTKRVLGEVFGG